MTVLHFSDTHLGFQAFDRVNEAGINAREQDVYQAFEQVVDQILNKKPDLVIHSGDFFHRPSPSNRALTFGLEQLQRISRANIPITILAGNHETPKTIYNSPILRALRSIDGVTPMFSEAWESAVFGDVVVHGVPHINDLRLMHRELERLEPVAGKFNILMLHTSLGRKFLMEEYGEQMFPAEFETKLGGFQYIALGHWHDCQRIHVHPNAWYCGSTERFSDTESGAEKGYLWLDIATDHSFEISFHPVETRPWFKWERKNCHEVSVSEIETELALFKEQHPSGQAILSLNFLDIRPEQSIELSNARLRQLFPDSFQIITRRKTLSDRAFIHDLESNQFDRLDQIFADYLKSKYPGQPELAAALIDKMKGYFQAV